MTIHAYVIEWIDSHGLTGWHGLKDLDHSFIRITSIGLLVQQDDDKVVITTSVSEAGDVIDVLAIPRVAIVKMSKTKFTVAEEPSMAKRVVRMTTKKAPVRKVRATAKMTRRVPVRGKRMPATRGTY